jgi:hypothetical protein
MGMCGQLDAPAALPQGKEPSVYIRQEARWVPELVWMLRRRESSLSHATNQAPNPQILSSRAMVTEIFFLLCGK